MARSADLGNRPILLADQGPSLLIPSRRHVSFRGVPRTRRGFMARVFRCPCDGVPRLGSSVPPQMQPMRLPAQASQEAPRRGQLQLPSHAVRPTPGSPRVLREPRGSRRSARRRLSFGAAPICHHRLSTGATGDSLPRSRISQMDTTHRERPVCRRSHLQPHALSPCSSLGRRTRAPGGQSIVDHHPRAQMAAREVSARLGREGCSIPPCREGVEQVSGIPKREVDSPGSRSLASLRRVCLEASVRDIAARATSA